MDRTTLYVIAAVAVGVWWAARRVPEAIEDAQLAVNDGFAHITGLADYERALMQAETPEQVRALIAEWESRPWWQKVI